MLPFCFEDIIFWPPAGRERTWIINGFVLAGNRILLQPQGLALQPHAHAVGCGGEQMPLRPSFASKDSE